MTKLTKGLPKVEECIAWAAQNGYCFAQAAADEYGPKFGREMVEDDNTAMYNTRSWRDMARVVTRQLPAEPDAEPPMPVDDGSCDPLYGQRMDSADMGEEPR